MLPLISQLFSKTGQDISLSSVQSAILLAIGLQHKDMDQIAKELNLPTNQAMAMFAKIIRKFSTYFRKVLSKAIEESMPDLEDENVDAMNGKETEQIDYKAIEQKLQDDLEEAGDEAIKEMRENNVN